MFLTLYTAGVYTDSEFREMWCSNSVLSQKMLTAKKKKKKPIINNQERMTERIHFPLSSACQVTTQSRSQSPRYPRPAVGNARSRPLV